jgi:hypothetical protein
MSLLPRQAFDKPAAPALRLVYHNAGGVAMQPENVSPDERIARWRRRVLNTIKYARHSVSEEATAKARNEHDSTLLSQSGWQALRSGDRDLARVCFRAAVHYDPYSVSAWLGLSRVEQTRDQRRAYIQAALDLQYLLETLNNRKGQDRR